MITRVNGLNQNKAHSLNMANEVNTKKSPNFKGTAHLSSTSLPAKAFANTAYRLTDFLNEGLYIIKGKYSIPEGKFILTYPDELNAAVEERLKSPDLKKLLAGIDVEIK